MNKETLKVLQRSYPTLAIAHTNEDVEGIKLAIAGILEDGVSIPQFITALVMHTKYFEQQLSGKTAEELIPRWQTYLASLALKD